MSPAQGPGTHTAAAVLASVPGPTQGRLQGRLESLDPGLQQVLDDLQATGTSLPPECQGTQEEGLGCYDHKQ
jgi:hypothetical protein